MHGGRGVGPSKNMRMAGVGGRSLIRYAGGEEKKNGRKGRKKIKIREEALAIFFYSTPVGISHGIALTEGQIL